MTTEQKQKIQDMRNQGLGYAKISEILGISPNTVKSYCRRNDLGGVRSLGTVTHACLFCGNEVKQNPGRKEKKYCNDNCWMAYWNSHQDKVERKAVYEFTCPYCGKPFKAYGNANRRYCSRLCYFTARYGYRDYWGKKYDESVLDGWKELIIPEYFICSNDSEREFDIYRLNPIMARDEA